MSFFTYLDLDGRRLDSSTPPYIVAEMSGNHGGDLEQALALIDAAADCGADAVKIQTYTADTMTVDSQEEVYTIQSGLWAGQSFYQLYQQAHTPWAWHSAMFERARQRGITLFSSPFDTSAVDFLESLDCPAYKIASFEIVDLPLIERVAGTGKPMIVSTGMASLKEIEEALSCAKDAGATQIALLHCISGYPTPLSECNLKTMVDLSNRFSMPVGLSDHTQCTTAASAAAALGACLIEKHFKISDDSDTVDADFSLSPSAFERLVQDVRNTALAVGTIDHSLKPSECDGRKSRRSIIAKTTIRKGEFFSEDNIACLRPGHGLHPRHYKQLIGKRCERDICQGEGLNEIDIGIQMAEPNHCYTG